MPIMTENTEPEEGDNPDAYKLNNKDIIDEAIDKAIENVIRGATLFGIDVNFDTDAMLQTSN